MGGVTVGVSRLKPAAPECERSTVRTDRVKRVSMLRQVRRLHSLIPNQEFTRQKDCSLVRFETRFPTIMLSVFGECTIS
jgi:hypothetical protein